MGRTPQLLAIATLAAALGLPPAAVRASTCCDDDTSRGDAVCNTVCACFGPEDGCGGTCPP